MDDAGPRSLFVVLDFCYNLAPYFSILQLETQVSNHEYAAHLTPKEIKLDQEETPHETPKEIDVDPEEYLVRFYRTRQPTNYPYITWLFCPPTRSTEDLYMVPNWGSSRFGETVKPLHGYKFSFSTGRFGSIKAPPSSQLNGHVVNVKGDIYFMAHADEAFHGTRDTVFECYDHYINSWKAPKTSQHSRSILALICATAVWGDIILFNVNGCDIWAFDSSGNNWYIVDAKDSRCYNFRGDAIVVGDTIYSLTNSYKSVLALHIEKKGTGNDVVFECSVDSEYIVQGLGTTSILEEERAWRRTRHFVHLGKDKFCIVESCQLMGNSEYEPILLIYIEECKGENKMTVTGTCIHRVKILQDGKFVLRFCFSLPEFKTTTLKEGKRLVFKFIPFEDYASKPGQQPGGADHLLLEPSKLPPELGHAINVRNLPPNANARQVKKVMKRFGRTKRVQVVKNEEGKCVAYVEFRSATSKQRALEVSTISIGGRVAEICEMTEIGNEINRPTLGQAAGKNKSKEFNNHGEDVRARLRKLCSTDVLNGEIKGLYFPDVNELCWSLNLEELRALCIKIEDSKPNIVKAAFLKVAIDEMKKSKIKKSSFETGKYELEDNRDDNSDDNRDDNNDMLRKICI